MTPLDKAREALAAVEKATSGRWQTYESTKLDCWIVGVGPVTKFTGHGRAAFEQDAAAIVSAVNFVRADLPALVAASEKQQDELLHLAFVAQNLEGDKAAAVAERERLADRVAKLEGALRWLRAFWKPGSNHDTNEVAHALANADALLTPAKGAKDGR